MTAFLAPLIVGLVTIEPDFSDHVDIIELNHTYDQYGQLVGTWWIFWEWDSFNCRYRVVDWSSSVRSVNVHHGRLSTMPERIWPRIAQNGPRWRLRLLDLGHRKVVACGFRETWTAYDPELADRAVFPSSRRRKLTPLEIPQAVRDRLGRLAE